MIFLKVTALAIVLIIVLRSIQNFYLKMVTSSVYRRIFLRWFPVLELVMWVGFVYWAVLTLTDSSGFPVYLIAGLTLVMLALTGWYLLRDVFAGFILRSENHLENGIRYRTEDTEGVISHIGYRSLELITDDGEVIKLPYTMIVGRRLVRPPERGQNSIQLIELEFRSNLQPDEVRQRLLNRVLEMPWVLSSYPPGIKMSIPAIGHYHVEITLRVISEDTGLKTKAQLYEFADQQL